MKLNNKGNSLISLLCILTIMVVIISCNINVIPLNITDNISDYDIKNTTYTIDKSLSQYAASHGGDYPKNLDELISLKLLSSEINLNKFNYNTTNKKYILSTTLKNGTQYISPLSE